MVKIAFHDLTTHVLLTRKNSLVSQIRLSPDLLRASYVCQYLTCGKRNCRCQRGFKHGPFYYLVKYLGTGRVQKFLLKSQEQRQGARAGIASHLKLQRQLARLSEINIELLRRGDEHNGNSKNLK